ncbi:restriction endonuclease subunit S [bacterium]|nr:restriction endonuclease subunit S [bacterium]
MAEKRKPDIRFKGYADDWEWRKLEDVVEFLDTMRKPLEGAKRIPGPYPYYGASGIVDYVDGYLFDEELVLLSEDGANITDRNYPVCFLASGKYWVNNHAHVLRTKDENENNFICNSLECKDYKQYNSGMAMPKLNQEVCRCIPISCPSFDEQKKIGDYFRKLDNLITLHQSKWDKLVSVKKFMLQKMFPQNGSNVPEIRFSGFTDAWEQRKLRELVDVCSGRDYKHLSEGNIPVYGTGGYMLSVSEALSYEKDAIGIGRKGTIDRPFILNAPFWTVDTLFYAIPRENVDLNFAFDIFQNIDWKKKDESTGVPSLSKTAINDSNVFVPKYDEQQVIGRYFSNLDHLITLHQRKLEKLKNIKKSMLEKMFL